MCLSQSAGWARCVDTTVISDYYDCIPPSDVPLMKLSVLQHSHYTLEAFWNISCLTLRPSGCPCPLGD